jgi:hypothetical protein
MVAFPYHFRRVVTLSFSPYIVVHVNTAYTRLTGYSSAKVLGKPLHDYLGAAWKDFMTRSTGAAPHPMIEALNDRITKITVKEKSKQKNNCCRLQAALVGPQLEGKNEPDMSSVTHYTVSFFPLIPSTETDSSNSRQQMQETGTGSSVSKKVKLTVPLMRSEESFPEGDARLVMG